MNLKSELREKLYNIKLAMRDMMSYTIQKEEPYDAQQALEHSMQVLELQYQIAKKKNQCMNEHEKDEKMTEEQQGPRLVKTMCLKNEEN